jgi:hypothetical protein
MPPFRTAFAGLAAFVLLCSAPCRLAAQRVRGDVLLPDSITRGAGVIVVATDGRGATITRGLTNERGEFDLTLPRSGRYDLHLLRIGFRPTVVHDIDVGGAEAPRLHVILHDEAVSLGALTVRGRSVCHIRADSGEMVARLWTEAGKAIVATQLSAPGDALVAHWRRYDRATDLSTAITLAERSQVGSGATDHPFTSFPPELFARVGYVVEDSSGVIYRAPDADVLLSDSFASEHCFHVEPRSAGQAGWVGIGFRPARERRGVKDIEGTLWLDRQSAELRQLEYRYTGLTRDLAPAEAGGTVEFLRLSTGNWLVHRWAIRMPRTTYHEGSRISLGAQSTSTPPRVSVDGLHFAGGEVTSVERGGELLYTVGEVAREDSTAVANRDAAARAVTCGTGPDNAALALVHGTVFEHTQVGVPGATVRVTWKDHYRQDGPTSWRYQNETLQATTSELGWWFICGVPRETLLAARASLLTRTSGTIGVRLPKDASVARVDIPLPPKH